MLHFLSYINNVCFESYPHSPFSFKDTEPETAESFWVELTEVNLLSGEQVQDVGPSIRHPGNLATITIIENDNARGMIQFDVMRVCVTSDYAT